MSLTFSTNTHTPSHLTTIPPELLLSILSHLPSTSLLPLSQTNIYLRNFLSYHSNTVINNIIKQNHTTAASILQTELSASGFLLPTHPLVEKAERGIKRERILSGRCSCRDCLGILSDSVPGLGLDDAPPSPTAPTSPLLTSHTRTLIHPSPSQQCNIPPFTTSLLSPGITYLLFLEKYSWEIETRYRMHCSSLSTASPIPNPANTAQPLNTLLPSTTTPSPSSSETEEKSLAFSFMIGNYCIKRFLTDHEREIQRLHSLSHPTSPQTTPPLQTKPPQNESEKKRKSWIRRDKVRRQKKEVQERQVRGEGNEREEGTGRGRRMFGEILNTAQNEKSSFTERRREAWVTGLVWWLSIIPSARMAATLTPEPSIPASPTAMPISPPPSLFTFNPLSVPRPPTTQISLRAKLSTKLSTILSTIQSSLLSSFQNTKMTLFAQPWKGFKERIGRVRSVITRLGRSAGKVEGRGGAFRCLDE